MMKDTRYGHNRYLLIKAKGGLGNRILSAVNGLIYADLAGRFPVIDWRDGVYSEPGDNAYPRLFESPIVTTPDQLETIEGVTPRNWRGVLHRRVAELIEENESWRHSDPFVYRSYCVDMAKLDQPEPLAVFWTYLPKFNRLRGHLARDQRFAEQSMQSIVRAYLDQYFTPVKEVRQTVDAIVDDIRSPVIGVHVRYTDRKISIDGIIRALDRQLKALPDASIFLATDNADISAQFKARYANVHQSEKFLADAGAILHSDRETTFDKVQEARNALVDMWALARCDRLIYSNHSTFSATSVLLGRLDANRAIDIDRWNLKVRLKALVRDYA